MNIYDEIAGFVCILIMGIAIGLWIFRLFICPVEIGNNILKIKQSIGNIENGYYQLIKIEYEGS